MKTADIEVDLDYAAKTYSGQDETNLSRVTVNEVGVERKQRSHVMSRHSADARRTLRDGIRVLIHSTANEPREAVIPAKDVSERWESYAERKRARQAEQEALEARGDAIVEWLASLGVAATRHWTSRGFELALDEIETLRDQVTLRLERAENTREQPVETATPDA